MTFFGLLMDSRKQAPKTGMLEALGSEMQKVADAADISVLFFFQLVLIFGPFWQYWVIFGPIWQYWVIFGPIWAILVHF